MGGSSGDRGKNRNFRGRGRGGYRGSNSRSNNSKTVDTDAEKNNPFYAQFKSHATFLDKRHDKREKLVKLSRDITIESKRIIFLLHRIKKLPNVERDNIGDDSSVSQDDDVCDRNIEETNRIFQEAEERLNTLESDLWREVANELEDEDNFLYLRSYTGGLQEYVEALSFYHHLKNGEMISWKEVQTRLAFKILANAEEAVSVEGNDEVHVAVNTAIEDRLGELCLPEKHVAKEERVIKVAVPQSDYMLGIADLTGEVMRQAINSAGAGNTATCFRLLTFLQEIHDGFVSLRRDSHREIPSKLRVLRQSLRKVENVCYNINVRGSEVPKHLLGTYLGISGQLNENIRSSDFSSGPNDEDYDFED